MPDKISPHGVVLISVASLMTLLSSICTVLRFVARKLSTTIGWDDWMALGALIFSYGYLVTYVISSTVGHGGYQIDQYNEALLENFFKACSFAML